MTFCLCVCVCVSETRLMNYYSYNKIFYSRLNLFEPFGYGQGRNYSRGHE